MNDIRNFAQDYKTIMDANRQEVMIKLDAERKCTYTYDEIDGYVRRMCAFLKANNVKAGDTLVTVLPNSVEAIVCFLGALLSGISYAPLPCTVSERECSNWCNIVKPSLIISKNNIVDYAFPVNAVQCNGDGDINSWLPSDEADTLTDTKSKIYLMTSGTTGAPKAMSIDINKLWSSGVEFADYYGIRQIKPRFWNYLPMSYLGGLYNLALIPFSCGGSFVITEPFSGKTILNYWNFVANNEITALWLVPSIVQGLCKIGKLLGSKKTHEYAAKVKICFVGTAPIRVKQKQDFEEMFGVMMYENFALSESTFLTAETKENIRFREESSVGTVLPYVSLKLKPVDGVEGVGGIWIKSPYLFDGYLDENGNVNLELDEEGYFNTKDLGYFNEDNVLVLSGRNRDIIKKGGNFVSLVEIEHVVGTNAYIEDCVAVPVEHEFYGEAYILCIISDDEGAEDKLRMWLLENIVPYKMPEKIIKCSSFPRTSSGKIIKNEIREKYYGK